MFEKGKCHDKSCDRVECCPKCAAHRAKIRSEEFQEVKADALYDPYEFMKGSCTCDELPDKDMDGLNWLGLCPSCEKEQQRIAAEHPHG